jgi:hypothetical protein
MGYDFTAEVLNGITLTDAQKEALGTILANPTVTRRLEESHLRQSDYSRQVAEAQAMKQKAATWYGELDTWRAQEASRLEAERAAFSTTHAGPTAADMAGTYLTQDKFNEELLKVQSGAIGFLSTMNDKSIEYLQEFGKRLDTNAVLAKAQAEGTNFAIAYDRLVQPLRDEKIKADYAAQIIKERAEAVREYQANQTLPTAQNPMSGLTGGDMHVLDRVAAKPAGESFGWRAAADAHVRDIQSGTVAAKATSQVF